MSPSSIDKYSVIRELGKGGMGVVYEAVDTVLRRRVAIKTILDPTRASEEDLERFRREAQAGARFRHEGIVELYEVGRHDGKPYLVMELVEGESFEALLKRERVAPRRVAEIVRGVALALAHAHERKILHRDVKPANVLVDRQGKPHLSDFGLARDEGVTAQLTVTGDILGTPDYMAPEQARGSPGTQGPHTDIYALGGLLYRGLAGRPPFQASNAQALLYKVMTEEPEPPSRFALVHRDLETIALRCLAKEPPRRYATASAVAEDLRRFLDGEPIMARPAGRVERVLRAVKANRLATALGLAIVLVGAGAALAERASLRRGELVEAREAAVAAVASFERALAVVPDVFDDTAAMSQRVRRELLTPGQRALEAAQRFRAKVLELGGSDAERRAAEDQLQKVALKLGTAALTWDEGELAASAFKASLEVKPDDPDTRDRLRQAERVASPSGQEAIVAARLAAVALLRNLPAFGSACVDRALALDADCVQAHLVRGDLDATAGRYDDSRREYTRVIAAKPTWVYAYLYRGKAAELSGQLETALADYTEALRRDPKHAVGYDHRARLHLIMNDPGAALRDADAAVRSMESLLPIQQAEILDFRGILRFEAGDVTGADEDLTRALELEGVKAEVWERRAEMRFRLGRRAEAIADFKKFLELDPANRRAQVVRETVRELEGGR